MYQDKVNQWLNEEKREPTPTQIKLINAISQYHPSHFLTVQLPLNWRNGGLDKYNAKLKAVINSTQEKRKEKENKQKTEKHVSHEN